MFSLLITLSRSVFDLSDRFWEWCKTPAIEAIGGWSDGFGWLFNKLGITDAPIIAVLIGSALIGILVYSFIKWLVGIVTGS